MQIRPDYFRVPGAQHCTWNTVGVNKYLSRSLYRWMDEQVEGVWMNGWKDGWVEGYNNRDRQMGKDKFSN